MGGCICQCLDLREELECEPAEGSRNLPARLDAAHCGGCEASADQAWRPQWGGSSSQLRSFPPLLSEPSPAGCPEQLSISCGERWGPAGVLAGGEELALGVGRRDGYRGGTGEHRARNKYKQPIRLSGEMRGPGGVLQRWRRGTCVHGQGDMGRATGLEGVGEGCARPCGHGCAARVPTRERGAICACEKCARGVRVIDA